MYIDIISIKNVSIKYYKERNVINVNDNESKEKSKYENLIYINVRGRLCSATPPPVIANRTPPPPSQKHHFTQKHQINFCIDENHRVLSGRATEFIINL